MGIPSRIVFGFVPCFQGRLGDKLARPRKVEEGGGTGVVTQEPVGSILVVMDGIGRTTPRGTCQALMCGNGTLEG